LFLVVDQLGGEGGCLLKDYCVALGFLVGLGEDRLFAINRVPLNKETTGKLDPHIDPIKIPLELALMYRHISIA